MDLSVFKKYFTFASRSSSNSPSISCSVEEDNTLSFSLSVSTPDKTSVNTSGESYSDAESKIDDTFSAFFSTPKEVSVSSPVEASSVFSLEIALVLFSVASFVSVAAGRLLVSMGS